MLVTRDMKQQNARLRNVDGPDGGRAQAGRKLRFGIFEVDFNSAELRKNGTKIKLQEQPFQVLARLLEAPGTVVSREELRERLWPADTFVDFDHSLNAAIRRLRDALGDSAENPIFVETVARRGYRFIAPVANNGLGTNETQSELSAPAIPANSRHKWIILAAGSVLLLLVGFGLGLIFRWQHRVPANRTTQLTANPADDRVRAAAISPDGRYLAFFDETGFYIRQIDTGETHPIALPASAKGDSVTWFPDSVHLLVTLSDGDSEPTLWQVSTLGENARKFLDNAARPAISPDGKEVAYIVGTKFEQEVWIAGSDGSQPRKLLGGGNEVFGSVAWSPDATKLAFARGSSVKGVDDGAIEVIELHGGLDTATVRPLSSWRPDRLDAPMAPVAWAPDGRLLYTAFGQPPQESESNLWSVALNSNGYPTSDPRRMTNDSGEVLSVTITADGKRVAYLKGIPQPDVYVANLHGTELENDPVRLTLDDHKDMPYDWTPDGKEVIFVSDRMGNLNIYKQRLDQTVPDMLVRSTSPLIESRLSPDGTQLLYVEFPKWGDTSGKTSLMKVPLAGGPSEKLVEASRISNHQCARAPAVACIYSVVANHTLTFFSYDPGKGKGTEIFHIDNDIDYNWSLSPDGKMLAMAKWKGENPPRIHLLPLDGTSDRWITVRGATTLISLDWAADSKTLWSASGEDEENALLNIDLDGRARSVWQPKRKSVGFAIPSRDGKSLALYVNSWSSNVWMLERP